MNRMYAKMVRELLEEEGKDIITDIDIISVTQQDVIFTANYDDKNEHFRLKLDHADADWYVVEQRNRFEMAWEYCFGFSY